MATATPRGRFLWHELLTSDPTAARAFYTKAIGWGTLLWENDPTYVMWTHGETPVGGLMRLPAEAAAETAPPNWLPYMGTPDVDATVARAKQLGAKVHKEPSTVPTVGRFAVLADPQGAAFAVFTAEGEPPGHEGRPDRGEFSWHELATTDPSAAWTFYHDLFGWDKTSAMDMGPAGTYQMYGRMGVELGGIYTKPPEMPGPSAWLCYVLVDDVHKRAPLVTKLGGKVLNGPMEVPGGDWIAQCVDPQGAAFAIHSRAKAAPVAKAAKRKAKPVRKATKKAPKRAAPKMVKKKAGKPKRGK